LFSRGKKNKKRVNKTLLKSGDFHLFLFSADAVIVRKAVAAGVDAVIVDWENQGKKNRQESFDTQINYDTFEDLCRVRDLIPDGKLICRINGYSAERTPLEIEMAVRGGADEIFLPMVYTSEEARQTCELVGNKACFNILIETASILEYLDELSLLPLNRVYVGLNDLHIQQNSQNIFVPLMNGTIRQIRSKFTIPVGAGGVTYPPSGYPIASKYLVNEYARLGINFSFLRRTFIRDHDTYDMRHMVENIKQAYLEATLRSPEEEENDFRLFKTQVESWTTNPHYV
jgi:hypothetical protein